jgi:hypothetical protein
MTDSANETGRGEAAGPQRGSLVGAKSATGADVATKSGMVEPSLSPRGEIALGYARRGLHVFPIKPGEKQPPLVKWSAEATTDKATVRRWWSRWPSANIGIACGPSNLCVIDLDQKNGKDGRAELNDLELTHGRLPATLTAQTPTGGWHLFFRGTTDSPIGKLGVGIDVKSAGGYVVAPGSNINAGEYAWCNGDQIAELPSWLEGLIGAPREHKERDEVPAVELDNEAAIAWAERYLPEDAPPAIAFHHGDDTTYKVAARLKGQGLSEPTALDMMLEHYNPRCDPPWTHEELQKRVAHGFRYAQNQAGSESAEADFANEPVPIIGDFLNELEPPEPKKRKGRFLSLDELLKLPPPQWLVRGLVPLETIGILYGPSLSRKSFLAFHLAACCATGREAFPGYDCKSADAFYIAAEAGHGFKLRAEAWIKHHDARPERLHLLAGSVFLDQRGEVEKLAAEINESSLPGDRRLIVVDTLSANFTGKENTDDVAHFLRRCTELARKCTATVLIVHHTGKDASKEERGHYSLRANVDFSIKMERSPQGAKVEVQKFKDADVGQPLHLREIVVEVAPGAEYATSLVLEKYEGAADDFDELDARNDIEALISRSDGLPLIKVAKALSAKWKKHDNTLKAWVQKVVGKPGQRARNIAGGTAWMEKAERGTGLIVRFNGTPAPQVPL